MRNGNVGKESTTVFNIFVVLMGIIVGIFLTVIVGNILSTVPPTSTFPTLQPTIIPVTIALAITGTPSPSPSMSAAAAFPLPIWKVAAECKNISQNGNGDSIFLIHSLCKVNSAFEIVYFNGPRGKSIFDSRNGNEHLLLNGKTPAKIWSNVAQLINATAAKQGLSYQAVHVYNEHKLGDLLLYIVMEWKQKWKRLHPILTEAVFSRILDSGQPPAVFTNTVDENWGFFSTFIGTRTTKWINMTNHLRIHEMHYDAVRWFLDSDKVVMVFCNTHVDPMIGAHRKVLSLPLGIRDRVISFNKATEILRFNLTKNKLLVINNSGWGDREQINAMVSAAFNGSVANSYERNNNKRRSRQRVFYTRNHEIIDESAAKDIPAIEYTHLVEMAAAKYVLCPSGLGFDTYRLWETILLGSIPVVESNAGFDRTYSHLPVLVVPSYSDLTPHLLENMYPCFAQNSWRYRYEQLTSRYWEELVMSAVREGMDMLDSIQKNHPFRNPYCRYEDFL